MAKLAPIEVCLEIDHETELELLEIDRQYLDGELSQPAMAAQASLSIMKYLDNNEIMLVKIFKPSNTYKAKKGEPK